jgi:hypothetical protein
MIPPHGKVSSMSTAKPSANVFGTFLDNVSSTPSKKSLDWDSVAQQAIEWSTGPTQGQTAHQDGAVSIMLRAIAASGAPQSVAAIVSSTKLSIDAVTSALLSAQTIGLVQQVGSGGDTKFELTAAGRDVLASSEPA